MTQIVGILNLTPDSFSDGGKYVNDDAALQQLKQFIRDGADVIDIGAESTRPDAIPLSPEAEIERLHLLPELIAFAHQHGRKISIDTRHARTASFALQHYADTINDVSGGQDDAMLEVIADAPCDYVIMHSLTVPADKSITIPDNVDATQLVLHSFETMIARCEGAGISKQRLVLDAGLGFGKNAQQSLQLIWNIKILQSLGLPLYYGHSRKSCFFDFTIDAGMMARDNLTLLASHFLMSQGADYIRVHDVKRHTQLRDALI